MVLHMRRGCLFSFYEVGQGFACSLARMIRPLGALGMYLAIAVLGVRYVHLVMQRSLKICANDTPLPKPPSETSIRSTSILAFRPLQRELSTVSVRAFGSDVFDQVVVK